LIHDQPTATPDPLASNRGDRERRTRQIGLEMLERARAAEPSILSVDWWSNHLQDWAMSDPRRRVQLFRFVDVFPTLNTDRDIIEHLNAYLLGDATGDAAGDPGNRGPSRLYDRAERTVLRVAQRNSFLGSQLAAIIRSQVSRMGRKFIVGQTADEAIATVQRLRDRRMAFTIDILGEATLSEAQADWYADQCRTIIEALSAAAPAWPHVEQIDGPSDEPMPKVNLSLKLSSLTPHFDPIDPQRAIDSVLARLRPIAQLARKLGAFINVDVEQYQVKDLTFAIFRKLLDEPEFSDWADVGTVLQAYLVSAPQDLRDMLEWVKRRGTPISLRLVKGAYWDHEVVQAIQRGWPIPVLIDKWRCDAAYEEIARSMLDHRHLVRPAFASHNIRSLAAALAYAEQIGASRRDYEIQMLFGMGDPLKRAVSDMGHTLRIYTPYGAMLPGMAYLIRRLLENTANESFVKATFTSNERPEVLLADPQEAQPPSRPLPRIVAIDPEDSQMEVFELECMADFSLPDVRRLMQQALSDVRNQFGRTYPLIIDGKPVETGGLLESLNPSHTREVVGRVHMAGREHVDRAVAAARACFDGPWSKTSATQRAGLLDSVADIMHRRRYELSAWIVFESGKPWKEADADVCEAIDFCRFYGREMLRLESQPRRRQVPGQDNVYTYAPRGVVAVIAPWNFPLAILTGMAAAGLAAGNTVVIKPAEQSPVIAAKLMEIVAEAGLPPGAINYLPGTGEIVGAALVDHLDVDVIAFTGSRDVGVHIYEQAGKWRPGQRGLKRVIAEMGGKNAIIVDCDADLDEAVAGVTVSAFGYAGQKCSACSRAIVHADVYDTFVERLVEASRAVVVGPAEQADTALGPVIDEESRARVLRYIELGKQEGRLVYQGDVGALAATGYFVAPTIFADVAPAARIAQEEVFGPLVAVVSAPSFDRAIEIANGTDYALTGGLYSRNPVHIERAKRAFRVGNLYINQRITGALVDRQPFGGMRMSGVGSKAGGPDYLLQFLEPRTITENTLRHGFTPELVETPVT
jgi:RHH-type proline utilization regulon transcriptional repressor/proline dehydrogenase/delta 1-pyrroline-5-carboxylate dehydrogenase